MATIAKRSEQDRHARNGDARGHRHPRRWNVVGSKGGAGVWQRIISEMPPHETYVEAFVGSGIIAQRKRPATSTIVIDADPAAPGLAMPAVIAILGVAHNELCRLQPQMDKSWLIYCDPPYPLSVRSCQRDYYHHEMKSAEAHVDLLRMLLQLPALVMVSCYPNPLYGRILADWRTIEIPTVKRNGERSTECVWMNFAEPFAFHDTRFLGKNFRERERIKRKKNRWKKRLTSMSRLDRAAVIDALGELISP